MPRAGHLTAVRRPPPAQCRAAGQVPRRPTPPPTAPLPPLRHRKPRVERCGFSPPRLTQLLGDLPVAVVGIFPGLRESIQDGSGFGGRGEMGWDGSGWVAMGQSRSG